MNAYIVAREALHADELIAALMGCGVFCRASQIVSPENIVKALESDPDAPAVIFWITCQVGSADLSQIRALTQDAQIRVVIATSEPSPDVIVSAVRQGATDFVRLGPSLREEVHAVVGRLSAQTSRPLSSQTVVTVLGSSGGCGASVVACNLAALLAAEESRCGLIDWHPRGGNQSLYLGTESRHTLTDLIRKGAVADDAMFQQSLVAHATGIHLLAAPVFCAAEAEIQGETAGHILRLATKRFSKVVIDLDREAAPPEVLRASTHIVLVTTLDFHSLLRAQALQEHLRELGVDNDAVLVVASRVGRPGEIPEAKARKLVGGAIAARIPQDSDSVDATINLAEPLVLCGPRTRPARAIRELVSLITNPSDRCNLTIAKPRSKIQSLLSSAMGILLTYQLHSAPQPS